jgi:hypothetical protein
MSRTSGTYLWQVKKMLRRPKAPKLQVIHALRLFALFPIPIADSAFPFIKREPLQGQKRPDHVFSDPLGLCLCLGPDPAVNIETRMAPGKQALCPFWAA